MYKILLIIAFAAILSGCTSLSPDKRAELDTLAQANINGMEAAYPGLEEKLETCKGYLALDAHHVKIPFIGWGSGKGVIVDNTTGNRTYVKVSRMDVGGGGGIREFDVLALIYDEKLLRYAKKGKWSYGLGAEASAGSASIEGSSGKLQAEKKYDLFMRSERGASATWTLHGIRIKPYNTL